MPTITTALPISRACTHALLRGFRRHRTISVEVLEALAEDRLGICPRWYPESRLPDAILAFNILLVRNFFPLIT